MSGFATYRDLPKIRPSLPTAGTYDCRYRRIDRRSISDNWATGRITTLFPCDKSMSTTRLPSRQPLKVCHGKNADAPLGPSIFTPSVVRFRWSGSVAFSCENSRAIVRLVLYTTHKPIPPTTAHDMVMNRQLGLVALKKPEIVAQIKASMRASPYQFASKSLGQYIFETVIFRKSFKSASVILP